MSSLGKGLAALIPAREGARHAGALSSSDPASAGDRIRVVHLSVDHIGPNPHQPRKVFKTQDLEELAGSIRLHGILEPLIVSPTKDREHYELIAGERRLRAAKLAGLKTVPAIIRSAGDMEKLELSIVENVQRADLNPIERAQAYRKLMEDFNLSVEEVSRRVGKSRPTVSNVLRLLTLPAHMQKSVADGGVPEAHARAILMLDDPALKEQLYDKILNQKMTQYEAEQTVRDVLGKEKHGYRKQIRKRVTADAGIAAGVELGEHLGTRVRIYRLAEHGKISILFASSQEFTRIMNRLLGRS